MHRNLAPLPLTLLAALLPVAAAQNLTLPGIGKVLELNNARQTIACGNGSVVITGNGNTLNLTGTCLMVVVNGNRNTVNIATVGTINATGNGNTIHWKKAVQGGVPVIRAAGSGNRISKG